jgi:hypothetical protein
MTPPKRTSSDSIACPACGASIPITETLHHQLADRIRRDLADELSQKEAELLNRLEEAKAATSLKEKALQQKERELRAAEEDVERRVRERIEQERGTLEQDLLRKAEEAVSVELRDLQTQNHEKDQRLKEAEEAELALRKRERALEEGKKALELAVARRLDEERRTVEAETAKRMTEEHKFKNLEKDKLITDMGQQIADLKHMVEQGSQQTQGEVLELELEDLLKTTSPYDDIQPVAKGKAGADILQRVFTRTGTLCGCIIWESKRTKNWSEGWIEKLKDDQRNAQADIAVLVTEALPKDVRLFDRREGVWVTQYSAVLGLAAVLRQTLEQVTHTKLAAKGKDEKMEVLFAYLTGPEFRQRVEAILETFKAMKIDLDREKQVFIRQWAKREKQITRILGNTAGMYGDLQGLIGEPMQPILALEAGEHDDLSPEPPAPIGTAEMVEGAI